MLNNYDYDDIILGMFKEKKVKILKKKKCFKVKVEREVFFVDFFIDFNEFMYCLCN